MAEEQRCQQPQRLCANNCGFFGSPTTQDFCSKCYRDLQLKEQGKFALNQPLPISSSSSSAVSSSSSVPSPAVDVGKKAPAMEVVVAAAVVAVAAPEVDMEKKDVSVGTQPNRCTQCNRRVGLTGFKCKCGMVFCGGHRYPELHGCSFDFKTLGKEQIAKENPVVKGKKLRKI